MIPGGSVESRQGLSWRAETASSTGFAFPHDTKQSTTFGRRALERARLSVRMDVFAQQHSLERGNARLAAPCRQSRLMPRASHVRPAADH